MRRLLVALCASALLLGPSAAGALAEDLAITITVSPNVVNTTAKGQWVTVHTDIAYGAVASATVTLNGVAVAWTKSDNQGNFVAKFRLDHALAIIAPPSATLTLSGETKGGDTFSGTDTIAVIQVGDKR